MKVVTWILIVAVSWSGAIYAQEPPAAALTSAAASAVLNSDVTPIEIVTGRSTVVDVGSAISRVSLSSPEIADALVTSSSQLLLHGKAPGTMSMFVWSSGNDIRRYEIAVQRDVTRLEEQIKAVFPKESITVRGNARHVVLSGPVSTKEVADKIA